MAVACSVNSFGQINKVPKTRSYTPRFRKDYSKPLHVDCSVEYELPNTAKPPVGNKNEPLLMIHPSYYRREESRHRSQFINNLPRRRASSRYCRNTSSRSGYTINNDNNLNYSNNEKTDYSDGRRTRYSLAHSSPKQTSMLDHKFTVNESCLPSKPDRHLPSQTIFIHPTDSAAFTSDLQPVDLVTLWKTIETNCLPQSSSMVTSSCTFKDIETQNNKHVNMMPLSELAPVPVAAPVPDALSSQIYDSWLIGCNDLNDNKNDNNNNNNNNARSKEKSKKNFSTSTENCGTTCSKVKSCTKKAATLNTAFPPASMSMSVVVSASTPASTANANTAVSKQQQPAVGVAAVAPPLNYVNCCGSLGPPIDGSACALLRQQPWSATTAPDFPSSSLPVFHKHPLPISLELPPTEITFPDSMPSQALSSSSLRKRTLDVSWWGDNINNEVFVTKRSKVATSEIACAKEPHANIVDSNRWFEKNVPDHSLALTEVADCCNLYYPLEPSCYSYSNNCRITDSEAACNGVSWNRPSENMNSLHLFHL